MLNPKSDSIGFSNQAEASAAEPGDVHPTHKAEVGGPHHKREASSSINQALSLATASSNRPGKSYSAATVAGKIYRPDNKTDASIIEFLSQSLSNNEYYSERHLHSRADAYLNSIDAEKTLISNASHAINNVESLTHKQSEWLCHLERGLWSREPALQCRDREKLGDEVLGLREPDEHSPYAKKRPWKISTQAASAFAMMLKGASGPFTEDQVKTGFELAQEGQLVAGRLKIQLRKSYREKNRHDADRSGTHSTKTMSGMDLSNDVGTRIRDSLQVPVMSGTSGSSSDVVIAAHYAAKQLGVPWTAPGLTADQAKDALINLSLDFFREKGPSTSMAKHMNAIREKQELPHKKVERSQVFTHSYAEISSAISLTLDEVDPTDLDKVQNALSNYTIEAKNLLLKINDARK
ncbi:secretion protein EspV [Xylophilus ampelinus]|uniref:Uncharacterized protein n=1 Tax=Xylophilus ampelinus TaxID=54067 RepID=A0A318SMR7_9BURK|nr:secretion protein EspV [Xylophilus ampelinus]MCS4510211.1 secretion protein EspV [Xylophilus ampelinus]PYE78170.1 hypothetical protein DFQ15_10983 [Xylophilus ampelinus]